jgi:Ni2+-binding GTPase involved in maturation of urease and hydrogenase
LIRFRPPRTLQVTKPVRIVLVGGFLGAGKTTALGALARSLSQAGLKAGFITNDQAPDLVDTAMLRRMDMPIAEVAGGCFCCRFSDLLDAAESVLASEPDVLLCEAVGSCTDMTATVLLPLRYFYRDQFEIAPFTVLVDPERVREQGASSPFAPEVGYIFGKQLEEADLILLNKSDRLSPDESDALARELTERYGKSVIRASALRGDGIDEWRMRLMGEAPERRSLLADLDYDAYAQGEAVLAWLNATVHLKGNPTFDPAAVARETLESLRAECARSGAEIAHLKLALNDGGPIAWGNVTRTGEAPSYGGTDAGPAASATLLLNARIEMSPSRLDEAAERAIRAAARSAGADIEIEALRSFSPSYPQPPYRMTEEALEGAGNC